jgi:hypothetical protein
MKITPASVATHIPLLTRAFEASLSCGDVLEVGTGYFSTTLLHWLATIHERHVYSYENAAYWYRRAQRHSNTYHHVVLCEDYLTADFLQRRWGLAFVDERPENLRHLTVASLAQTADYIVIHDTVPEWEARYQYGKIWHLFKYRYDYTRLWPYTSVVSNFHDVTGWGDAI